MNQDHDRPRRLLIGDLLLDVSTQTVSRSGETIDLPRLSYRLLLALADAAPAVLTHDAIVEHVWDGRVVSPETVTQRIKLLRKSLGDDAVHPRYVGVVRGQGYRLLTEVEQLPADDGGTASGLFAELKRRRVLQVALLYAAVAWSITEVVSFLLDALPVFPAWSKTLVAIIFVVGFPVAMLLAWRFDIGADGIKRTQASSREGRLVIAAALLLLIGATGGLFYLIYPSVLVQSSRDAVTLPGGGVEAAPNTIAVLPFENASGSDENRFISEGLGDALRDQLGRLGGLRVAARSSSVIFGDRTVDAIGIADRLGVGRLIEGTVRRQDDRLAITVYIIDGETGFQIWSQPYDRSMADLLAVQQDIARDIVATLLPERDDSLGAGKPASLDPTANELMLLARYYYQQVRDQSIVDVGLLLRSINLYRQAIEADPNSALAHSRLGAALLYLGDVEAAEQPIFRALSIDPDISEVQYTLGLYYWLRYLPGSGDAHRRAVDLNPNNPDANDGYAKWLWHQLIVDEPEQYFLKALEVDPMSLARYADLGTYYGMNGMAEKARNVVPLIEERFSTANAYMVIARILEIVGEVDEAIAWALLAYELEPDNQESAWQVAELYARLGDFDKAREYESDPAFNLLYWERRYEEMIQLGEELVIDHPNQVQLWYGLARALSATGQYEQAVYVLRSQDQPARAKSENRRANDEEAMVTLADALKELGKFEEARELAEWIRPKFRRMIDTGGDRAWWGHFYLACTLSILDDDEAALDELGRVVDAVGLPWYPVLADAPCFRRFASEPRYQAVVRAIGERKQKLRERLPQTLERMRSEFRQ
jgi:TolB-like protein/DNA-binding winged helix-turn-helix (wHTH) protein/Flp pilus assembly protein TadD